MIYRNPKYQAELKRWRQVQITLRLLTFLWPMWLLLKWFEPTIIIGD